MASYQCHICLHKWTNCPGCGVPFSICPFCENEPSKFVCVPRQAIGPREHTRLLQCGHTWHFHCYMVWTLSNPEDTSKCELGRCESMERYYRVRYICNYCWLLIGEQEYLNSAVLLKAGYQYHAECWQIRKSGALVYGIEDVQVWHRYLTEFYKASAEANSVPATPKSVPVVNYRDSANDLIRLLLQHPQSGAIQKAIFRKPIIYTHSFTDPNRRPKFAPKATFPLKHVSFSGSLSSESSTGMDDMDVFPLVEESEEGEGSDGFWGSLGSEDEFFENEVEEPTSTPVKSTLSPTAKEFLPSITATLSPTAKEFFPSIGSVLAGATTHTTPRFNPWLNAGIATDHFDPFIAAIFTPNVKSMFQRQRKI